ncbi:uncharacterized protein BDW43DRAFT_259882 [Aspergillus alliaceus]|uniref:uncharacterized protein n=1 Tax=Petromyces alliaceus TaxID=209559 RepID=UPI0012A4D3C8|nr:uncharacterized protein BDW43DRAFT_259882 [Aspergillus alliaceus]KAB8238827.1 hypothetical protein BDW43DRAFT_259882 [Aspergillus alliaceus]
MRRKLSLWALTEFPKAISWIVEVSHLPKATACKGEAHVILNSLSSDFLESWQYIAMFGRSLELGKKDIQTNRNLPMLPFSKNPSFHTIDLNEAQKHQSGLLNSSCPHVPNQQSSGATAGEP